MVISGSKEPRLSVRVDPTAPSSITASGTGLEPENEYARETTHTSTEFGMRHYPLFFSSSRMIFLMDLTVRRLCRPTLAIPVLFSGEPDAKISAEAIRRNLQKSWLSQWHLGLDGRLLEVGNDGITGVNCSTSGEMGQAWTLEDLAERGGFEPPTPVLPV